MRVVIFSTKTYDRTFLTAANAADTHRLSFVESRLNAETARLAQGNEAVCIFVNDRLDEEVIKVLGAVGIRLIALRCAGFNNVDLHAAARANIPVCRVPSYSPHAIAEHTLGMVLTLNRKLHRAYNRVREGNFDLEGLLGFDLHGKTVGIAGTGKIGRLVARIFGGFGCRVMCHDPYPTDDLPFPYVGLEELFATADIVTLHCPLTPQTHHMVNDCAIARMKTGVMLINTSRGAVVDTRAVVRGLKSGKIGTLGLDVYEEEADLFFQDLSDKIIDDDVFARLLTFPNVLITAHQAFFTKEALTSIAETTLANVSSFEATGQPLHSVTTTMIAAGGQTRPIGRVPDHAECAQAAVPAPRPTPEHPVADGEPEL